VPFPDGVESRIGPTTAPGYPEEWNHYRALVGPRLGEIHDAAI